MPKIPGIVLRQQQKFEDTTRASLRNSDRIRNRRSKPNPYAVNGWRIAQAERFASEQRYERGTQALKAASDAVHAELQASLEAEDGPETLRAS